MAPILGILASQNYPRSTNSYESIATTTLTTDTSSVTFSSIPSTYQHLQVRMIARNNIANTVAARNAAIRFNGDSGTNYAIHYVAGDGSSAFTDAASSQNQPYPFAVPDGNTTANAFGAAIFDILDYADTNKYKTLRSLTGSDVNGSGTVRLNSTLWMSTSAINSITFFTYNGTGAFVANSHFALYGIKG